MEQGLIAYHKSNDIITMKEHLDVEHKIMYVKYLEEAFNCFKGPLEQAITTKRVHVTLNVILFFHKSLPKEPQHFCRRLNVLCDQGIYAIEECRFHLETLICIQVVP